MPLEPVSSKIRDDFELLFEQKIVSESVTEKISSYKKMINREKSKELLDYIEELTPPTDKENLPIELFRIISSPSLNSAVSTFSCLPSYEQIPFLKFFFDNIEKIKCLKSLHPIIEFTDYMLEKFNFSISRQEAYKAKIGEFLINDHRLNVLFSNFVNAWNRITIDLNYNCLHITEKMKFDENSPLIYFLIDDKEILGLNMAAALKTLAEIQNELLSLIDTKYERTYSVQNSKASNIINFKLSPEEIVLSNFMNNYEYGKGKEIFYDFEGMFSYLQSEMKRKVTFNTLDFSFITYKFELYAGENSSILSNIKKLIKQYPLSTFQIQSLKTWVLVQKSSKKPEFEKTICNIRSSLEIILNEMQNHQIFLKHDLKGFLSSKNEQSKESFKIITNEAIFMNTKLVNIVGLFEFVEKKSFEFILGIVKNQFKKRIEDVASVETQIEKLLYECLENDQNPMIKDVKNALMRFISRRLVVDLDPDKVIAEYICDESLWSEDNADKIQNLAFPTGLCLSYAVHVYEIIKDVMKRFKSLKKSE